VVIVQHAGSETALNAGDSWGCDSHAIPTASASAALEPAPAPESGVGERHPVPRGSARVTERGTLGEESRLMQNALAAERLGQPERAQVLLNQLLVRYPNSPLSSEARRASARIAGASPSR